jgi:hypothetical protein
MGLLALALASGLAWRVWKARQPIAYPVGEGPQLVIAADLDGNRDIDLIAAKGRGTADSISLLANRGDSTFDDARSLLLPGGVRCVAAVDLDDDRDLDLLATSQYGQRLIVLRNVGGGVLAAPETWPLPSAPAYFAPGDFDGDDDVDVAVTGNPPVVWVLWNDGAGNFATRIHIAVEAPTAPVTIAAADLDGDGKLDLAMSHPDKGKSRDLLVLRNLGGHRFAPGAPIAAGGETFGLALADWNGDGKVDVAGADPWGQRLWAAAGEGEGRFGPPRSIPVGTAAQAVAAGDFDGDARLDLAAVGGLGTGELILLRGDGALGFEVTARLAVGKRAGWLTASDLDADGDLDLAVCGYGSGDVTVLRNHGGRLAGW